MNGNGDLLDIFGDGFDTQSVEPQADFPIVPPGKYSCIIDKAEVKQTKKGDGHYIEIQLSIIGESPYKNRKIWDRINIDNPSSQCVEIGLRCLAALGIAAGVSKITDSAQLVGKIVIAHVKVKDDNNEVRTYSQPAFPQQPGCPPAASSHASLVPQSPQPQQPVQPPVVKPTYMQDQAAPQQSNGQKPPWAR